MIPLFGYAYKTYVNTNIIDCRQILLFDFKKYVTCLLIGRVIETARPVDENDKKARELQFYNYVFGTPTSVLPMKKFICDFYGYALLFFLMKDD